MRGAALNALLRKNKLRDQPPVRQAALKVMQAQWKSSRFYYRLPSSFSESGCGEIGLLDYGQAAGFKSGAHFRCRSVCRQSRIV